MSQSGEKVNRKRVSRNSIFRGARPRLARAVLAIADATALLSSMAIALLLRFDGTPWAEIYRVRVQDHTISLPIAVALYLVIYSAFRLYRYAWRFAGLEMLWALICANTVGIVGLILVQLAVVGTVFPRSVLVMTWVISIVLTASVRVLLRVLSVAQQRGTQSLSQLGRRVKRKRTIIMGSGANGALALRAIREDSGNARRVIGLLCENPMEIGAYVGSVRIIGDFSTLHKLLAGPEIDEVIVAVADFSAPELAHYVLACQERQVSVKIVPNHKDALSGKGAHQLIDYNTQALLEQRQVAVVASGVAGYITGKRVMVTGAGGSIGSELCRQVAAMGPGRLILLGHGENSIHRIYQELRDTNPGSADSLCCVIASVSHKPRLEQVFREHNPEIVFHAAAHKHVPLMENNEREAVWNNVIGTYNVAEACGESGVQRVVVISTDKAADPCCVMGATKWMCEEIVRASAVQWPDTAYMAARFGNVLGSRGSVMLLFREQIKRGGPVTITHPDMTRYFMTIPDAVSLVLQAGAVGMSGGLYLLDMGEPIRVVEMARKMIRLCGLEPEVDIKTRFTGPRPGERLHERLISPDEYLQPTALEGMSLIQRPSHLSPQDLQEAVRLLGYTAEQGTDKEVRRLLEQMTSCREKTQVTSDPSTSPSASVNTVAGNAAETSGASF